MRLSQRRGPRTGPPPRPEPAGEAQRAATASWSRRSARPPRGRRRRRRPRAWSCAATGRCSRRDGPQRASATSPRTPSGLRAFRRDVHRGRWNLLEEMPKPTICQIHGACIGRRVRARAGLRPARDGRGRDVGLHGGAARADPRRRRLLAAARRRRARHRQGADHDRPDDRRRRGHRIGLANRIAPADELDAVTEGLRRRAAGRPRRWRSGFAKRVLDAVAKPALAATLEQEVAAPADPGRDRGLRRGRRGLHGEAPAGVRRAPPGATKQETETA